MPRDFFENHVKPNYQDWLAAPLDQRLAKNAVADANNMAAHVFRCWHRRDRAQVYGAINEGHYRDGIAARVHRLWLSKFDQEGVSDRVLTLQRGL